MRARIEVFVDTSGSTNPSGEATPSGEFLSFSQDALPRLRRVMATKAQKFSKSQNDVNSFHKAFYESPETLRYSPKGGRA